MYSIFRLYILIAALLKISERNWLGEAGTGAERTISSFSLAANSRSLSN